MKKLLLCMLSLMAGIHIHAQMPYAINSFGADLQSNNLTLISSGGNLVSGQLNGATIRLYHILFSPEDKITTYQQNSVISNEIIQIYPNPFRNELYLESKKQNLDKIIIVNAMGEKVLESPYTNSVLNLSELNSGIYLLRILNKSSQVAGSFTIVKL
jgi:hypothetical protein